MKLHAAATTTPAAFERVARDLGTGWLAALRSAVEPGRLAALDGWLRTRPRDDVDIARWAATEGAEAGWSIVQLCREFLEGGPPHLGYGWRIPMLFQSFARGNERVERPWLWVELFAQIPGTRRTLAQDLDREASGFGELALPAIEHALRTWPAFPHRGMLARRLVHGHRLDPELAMQWLADPALRELARTCLRPHVAALEGPLRERLEAARGGTREAIVRLLRAVDARMGLDGKTEATDDAELQARLRADPRDATTSMVWVDLLGVRGDPRGEHLALEHAIAAADPERGLELSRAQAAVCGEHRQGIWHRPGGFPFREKYRGRDLVAFRSDHRHRIRGKPPTILDRLQRFVNHVTDVRGPSDVHLGRAITDRVVDAARALPTALPATALETELVRVLGDAAVVVDADHVQQRVTRVARRALPTIPLADEAGFRQLCVAHPDLTLVYRFQLTWPGTRIPLPHQEGEHYATGEPLASWLVLYLARNDLSLCLQFPFESFSAPGFLAIYDAICTTLGRVLTPSRFLKLAASADGKHLVQRLARFARSGVDPE